MSWSDYTNAKHFGEGIFRPYSDFLADVLLALDNRLASQPEFGRSVTPFPMRDTILVLGEAVSIIAVSRESHRHYPLFSTYKWGNLWKTDEPALVSKLELSVDGARRIANADLDSHLQRALNFVAPIIFSVPTVFLPLANTPQNEVRSRSVSEAAEILFFEERRHYDAMHELNKPKEIFLSHKSVDKALVREAAATLEVIGFQPWLDEDKMKAGANLERAIRDGFASSCAAVFFVTPNFSDQGFLATEIDYALAEKREKGDRFAIITLLLRGSDGGFGVVPQMIKQFVWKQVDPSQITRIIVEALPVRMERVVWRG